MMITPLIMDKVTFLMLIFIETPPGVLSLRILATLDEKCKTYEGALSRQSARL
jgi:hypothetical protein